MSFTDFSNHASLSSFLVGEGKGLERGRRWRGELARCSRNYCVWSRDEERTCQCWLGGGNFMRQTRDSASQPDGRVQFAKRAWLRVRHGRACRAERKRRERHAAHHAQRLISLTLYRRALRRSLGRPLRRGDLQHVLQDVRLHIRDASWYWL